MIDFHVTLDHPQTSILLNIDQSINNARNPEPGNTNLFPYTRLTTISLYFCERDCTIEVSII